MTALEQSLLAAAVDAVFDCAQATALGPCVFPAGHDGDCVGLLPVVPLCRLCRGRTRVPGTDDTCPHCGGAGIEEVAA